MPRVLIAGCGYVGNATADLFRAGGWTVEGWTSRQVDISDQAAVESAAGGFDVIIQAASSRGGNADAYRRVYLDGARNLSRVFPSALHLFVSSTSVYGQSGGEWVDENSPAEPQRETGQILREAEEVVLRGGGIVTRLGGIYGPGRSALLRKFLAGDAVLEERFVNQVHRDDAAAALFFLAQRPERGAIFNLTDNHPLPLRECYEWLASFLHREMPPSGGIPRERKRGNSNKRVRSEKLLSRGWSPRYPTFAAGMSESVLPNFERLGA